MRERMSAASIVTSGAFASSSSFASPSFAPASAPFDFSSASFDVSSSSESSPFSSLPPSADAHALRSKPAAAASARDGGGVVALSGTAKTCVISGMTNSKSGPVINGSM